MKPKYLNPSSCIPALFITLGGVVACEINTDPSIARNSWDAVNPQPSAPASEADAAVPGDTQDVDDSSDQPMLVPATPVEPETDAGLAEPEPEPEPVNGAGLGIPMPDDDVSAAQDPTVAGSGSSTGTPDDTVVDTDAPAEGEPAMEEEPGFGEPEGETPPQGGFEGPFEPESVDPEQEPGAPEEPGEGEAPESEPPGEGGEGSEPSCDDTEAGCESSAMDAGAGSASCPGQQPSAESMCDRATHAECTYGAIICLCVETDFGEYWSCE